MGAKFTTLKTGHTTAVDCRGSILSVSETEVERRAYSLAPPGS